MPVDPRLRLSGPPPLRTQVALATCLLMSASVLMACASVGADVVPVFRDR